MTVLIDTPLWPKHGTMWSHLVSDESIAELRAFADRAGLPVRAFDLDHYDVPVERYDELVAEGAVPVSPRELVRRLAESGLRVSPRERRERRSASPG
jgi:protein-L-isoaspartate O-methyltransferase